MDMMGDIYRYFMQAWVDRVTYELQDKINWANSYVESFIYMAGYSYQPGRSKKLIRMILNSLNVNTVNRLRSLLTEQLAEETMSTSHKFRTFTITALECIQSIQTPFSLKSMSRRVINRVMSTRSLDNQSLSNVVLPVSLKKYGLHQEYDDCVNPPSPTTLADAGPKPGNHQISKSGKDEGHTDV